MSAPHPSTGSGREPATVRIAMWSAHHRWPVVALWFLATIGLFGTSIALGGIKAEDASGGPNQRPIEASGAYDVFNAGEELFRRLEHMHDLLIEPEKYFGQGG